MYAKRLFRQLVCSDSRQISCTPITCPPDFQSSKIALPHIGIALLIAFPVSTGKASTLTISAMHNKHLTLPTFFLHLSHSNNTEATLASKKSICYKLIVTREVTQRVTHRHAHCDNKSKRRTDDLAVARILISVSRQHKQNHERGAFPYVPHWKQTIGRGTQSHMAEREL